MQTFRKILVACRDDQCYRSLLTVLNGEGRIVHSVREHADLLMAALDKDYDCIIYDLELSKSDGIEMVKIIRRIRPKVSLIVTSNDCSLELGGKIIQEGVVYYGIKPINPFAVAAVLGSILN